MKKLFALLVCLVAFMVHGQERYFTLYSFTANPKDHGTVYQLVHDFYSKNKPAGVTISLYENHLSNAGNQTTHTIVFSGTLDAVGGMYTGDPSESFELFLTRLNGHISESGASVSGHTLSAHGDASQPHPIQRVVLLDVEDEANFLEGFNKFNSSHRPADMTIATGVIDIGHAPDGANHWVVLGFKDFKSALGGATKMLSGAALDARNKAWDEYMASLDSHGGVKLVSTGLRILLGEW